MRALGLERAFAISPGKLCARLGAIGAFLGLIAVSIGMLSKVTPFEVQTLLAPSHPVRQAYEDYLDLFDDGRSGFILVHSKYGAFAEAEMRAISKEIGDYLRFDPDVASLVGPHNAKYMVHATSLHLKPFFVENRLTEEGKARLKTELWRRSLISDDFSSFLIQFDFTPDLERSREQPFLKNLNEYLASVVDDHPGIEIHTMGTKVASAAFMDEMAFNLRVITPALLLCIGIFLFFLYRSWEILAWNFAVMLTCYMVTLLLIIGLEGGLGPYSNFALMFSFIVATTDLIHFFCRFQRLEGSVETRLREAWRIAYVPCLLTSLVTAAGFIGLVVNQNLPIRYFGIYCAFACLLEWVVIFYLLPPLLRLFDFSARARSIDLERPLHKYVSLVRDRAGAIVAGSLLAIGLGAVASESLKVDDNFYTKFKSSHPLSRAVEAFSRDFQFMGSIDLLLKPKEGDYFDRENLDAVRKIERELQALPEVSHLSSARQISDELAQELAKRPAAEAESVRRSALSLLTDSGELESLYNTQENEGRTVVFLRSLDTADFTKALADIEQIRKRNPGRIESEVGGFANIRNFINTSVIHDLAESLAVSFLLTFLCFIYLYKSVRWAFLALLPNLLPLVAITGLMGLAGVKVDGNLAIMICVAFGISGDNTVHLTYVLRQNRKQASDYLEGLSLAVRQIGVPIVATSAIFIFCLPCFLLGHLKLFSEMAIFLSIAFATAFFSDLFSFPAFHVLLRKRL